MLADSAASLPAVPPHRCPDNWHMSSLPHLAALLVFELFGVQAISSCCFFELPQQIDFSWVRFLLMQANGVSSHNDCLGTLRGSPLFPGFAFILSASEPDDGHPLSLQYFSKSRIAFETYILHDRGVSSRACLSATRGHKKNQFVRYEVNCLDRALARDGTVTSRSIRDVSAHHIAAIAGIWPHL
mmetsp:Transcript_432/g.1400  ORF Transcript_432/g.1400 Transcript_432/m.1400 type:complete len:185 (-) Transcript_432:117-671(-)